MLSFLIDKGVVEASDIFSFLLRALLLIVFFCVILIFYSAVWIKLFEKLYRPCLCGLIPIYRGFVIARSCRSTMLYCLMLALLPVYFALDMCVIVLDYSVPFVLALIILSAVIFALLIKISCAFASTFDKGVLFGIFLAVLPVVALPILAFGSDVHFGRLRTVK